ncbi:hypothetical protein C8R46DRAFT_1024465 [Mycena filopes]|nr:hypothetical protein C8R46DRAFT_1024465 [Mycena filopes]
MQSRSSPPTQPVHADAFGDVTPGGMQETATINVFAAIVTEERAFVVTDCNRLTRLHIVSSSRKFVAEDIAVGSSLWQGRLWHGFTGAPDWALECDDALKYLDQWRQEILGPRGRKKYSSILDVLIDADGPGGGIGKHLGNDFLFEIAIHPETPCVDICNDDKLYNRVRGHLPVFMAQWISPKFLKACGGRTNSLNPFAFNTTSHRNFLACYVSVYRRQFVRVKRDLYNFYLQDGLFDPDHIIGTPYLKPVTLTTLEWKEVEVRCFRAKSTNRYHIILAQVPPGWNAYLEDFDFEDVSNAGFATTLGVASFREPVQNKPDLELAKTLVRRGRPPKVRTGLPGRPRNSVTTLSRIHELEAECRVPKRKRTRKENKENEEPLGSEIPDDGPRRSKRLKVQ